MGLLKDVLKGKTGIQKRLWAATWRRRVRLEPPSPDPVVLFCIPLTSKARSEDWSVVERNLERTLAALEAQSDPGWRAVVCGQDRPETFDFGPRVAWLRFTGGSKYYDKGDKRIAMINHIAREVRGDGYYVQFDADDIAHPDLVAHIRRDNNGRGYLIRSGYMADLSANRFAPLAPPTESAATTAFDDVCGSSAAIRFDFRSEPRGWSRLLGRMSSHRRVTEWMDLVGLPLDAVPFPAAIYLVNHGENMRKRRGQNASKVAYLDVFEITDPEERDAVRAAFGIEALPSA